MLRESRGLSQEGLADRLTARGAGVSGNAVSQWERGETANIKLRTFLALGEELGTTHESLGHGPSDPGSRDSSGRFRKLTPGSDSKP
jgi:transcriptional regulator with XRE-family HTH domain